MFCYLFHFLLSLLLLFDVICWEIIGNSLFVDILGCLASVLFPLTLFIGYQDIMYYVQSGEVLYIPGAMTPTEVRVNFLGSKAFYGSFYDAFLHP